MAKAEIRMTEGPIAKQLVSFAIPLFLGFLFQQLYNTADALIVGNLLGNSALAAVTGTGTLIFLLVGFFGGDRDSLIGYIRDIFEGDGNA